MTNDLDGLLDRLRDELRLAALELHHAEQRGGTAGYLVATEHNDIVRARRRVHELQARIRDLTQRRPRSAGRERE